MEANAVRPGTGLHARVMVQGIQEPPVIHVSMCICMYVCILLFIYRKMCVCVGVKTIAALWGPVIIDNEIIS